MSGEASIAVVRGEPRMGYELSFKAELTGDADSYLADFVAELEIEELCDDSVEPADFKLQINKLLDTQQGSEAKKVLGHDNECVAFCKAVSAALKKYPYHQ